MNNTYGTERVKSRDKLKGAPGHQADESAAKEKTNGAKPAEASTNRQAGGSSTASNKKERSSGGDQLQAVSAAVTKELAGATSSVVEDIVERLGVRFGKGKVDRWYAMLAGSGADGQGSEASLYNIVKAAVPNIPEGFSMSNLSTLTEWEPIRDRIAKRPIASAAIAAAGVGALVLLREYLNGNMPKDMSFAGAKRRVTEKLTGTKKARSKVGRSTKSKSTRAKKV